MKEVKILKFLGECSTIRYATGPQWETSYLSFEDLTGKKYVMWECNGYTPFLNEMPEKGKCVKIEANFKKDSFIHGVVLATEVKFKGRETWNKL